MAETVQDPDLVDKTAAAQDPYDADADRKNASEILDQARWLFEQHERRSDSAQKLAAAVLAFTGTIVTFVLKGISPHPSAWQAIGMIITLIAGLVTALFAVLALAPRLREKGLPSFKALREFAKSHDDGRTTAIPVNQFVADLLNAKHLDQESPIDLSHRTATLRVNRLRAAYVGLGITFAFTMILMFLVAVIP